MSIQEGYEINATFIYLNVINKHIWDNTYVGTYLFLDLIITVQSADEQGQTVGTHPLQIM